jgi:hypothetical protein
MGFLLGLAVGLFVATFALLWAAFNMGAGLVAYCLLGISAVIVLFLVFAVLDRVVEQLKREDPDAVSKWFRLDWQYVLRAGRLPAVKPVAVVLVAFPVLGDLTSSIDETTPGFWFIWLGGVASLLAFVLTWLRCPSSVREYETFKDFEDMGHSHRWIGWLFRNHQHDYVDREDILKETLEKKLAFRELDVCNPSALAQAFEKVKLNGPQPGPAIVKPINLDRDLFVGFWLAGEPYVIPLQEEDPKINEKIKELFWIISTDLLGSRPLSRYLIWTLYAITVSLFVIALVMNLAKPLGGLQRLFG